MPTKPAKAPAPKRDMRNHAAKARDAFLESEAGQRALSGVTSGQYLRNRLITAFESGYLQGTHAPKEKT